MDKIKIQKKFSKKGLGVLTVVAVIIIVLICSIAMYLSSDTKRLQRQLELGQKYLVELDYEQAAVEFEKAIEIDPMSVDAYLGLAEAYEGMGDIDMAVQVLEQGYEITGDERILDVLEELVNIEESDNQTYSEDKQEGLLEDEDTVTMMYQAYYDKLIEIQNQYGLCDAVVEKIESDPLDENEYLIGLCFAKIIDFDGDGVEELLLGYYSGEQSGFIKKYVLEIWAYQNNSLQMKCREDTVGAGGSVFFYINFYDEKYYITYEYAVEGVEEYVWYEIWYGYVNGKFDITKEYIASERFGLDTSETYLVDGTEVTHDEWLDDRNNRDFISYEYGFQNVNYILYDTIDELVNTFKTLSEYLGIEWIDNISRIKKPYSDSIWKRELIGYWETINYESLAEWETLTLYEDGMAELHMHNSVGFGTFEIESEGSVMLYISDEYEYDNAEVQWSHYIVDWQIQLTEGRHTQEMIVTCINDNDETFPFYGSLVLTRIHEDGADYSSADTSIQYYKGIVAY